MPDLERAQRQYLCIFLDLICNFDRVCHVHKSYLKLDSGLSQMTGTSSFSKNCLPDCMFYKTQLPPDQKRAFEWHKLLYGNKDVSGVYMT